jgi:ketosteroid isomerase-like protein
MDVDDAEIEIAGTETSQRVARLDPLQRDGDGVPARELGESCRDERCPCAEEGAEAQSSRLDPRKRSQLSLGLRHAAQDFDGVVTCALAGRRQPHRPRAPIHEGQPQLSLQSGHVVRDNGLRVPELERGRQKRAPFRNLVERAQPPQVIHSIDTILTSTTSVASILEIRCTPARVDDREVSLLEPELMQAIEEDHRALNALILGDPEPKKGVFSECDDVTLANPLGLPIKGRREVEKMLDRVASQMRDGEPHRFQRVSEYATGDLAYVVEIERTAGVRLVTEGEQTAPFSLRATTVWRREGGEWRIAHRHADPITTPRGIASILEQQRDDSASSGEREIVNR